MLPERGGVQFFYVVERCIFLLKKMKINLFLMKSECTILLNNNSSGSEQGNGGADAAVYNENDRKL